MLDRGSVIGFGVATPELFGYMTLASQTLGGTSGRRTTHMHCIDNIKVESAAYPHPLRARFIGQMNDRDRNNIL